MIRMHQEARENLSPRPPIKNDTTARLAVQKTSDDLASES